MVAPGLSKVDVETQMMVSFLGIFSLSGKNIWCVIELISVALRNENEAYINLSHQNTWDSSSHGNGWSHAVRDAVVLKL